MKKSQQIWTVYILECGDKTLYTGITTDLESRLAKHKLGRGAKYTKGREPICVVHIEKFESRSKASVREAEIKALSRTEKLALIAS